MEEKLISVQAAVPLMRWVEEQLRQRTQQFAKAGQSLQPLLVDPLLIVSYDHLAREAGFPTAGQILGVDPR